MCEPLIQLIPLSPSESLSSPSLVVVEVVFPDVDGEHIRQMSQKSMASSRLSNAAPRGRRS
jgi:hypothetical protein